MAAAARRLERLEPHVDDALRVILTVADKRKDIRQTSPKQFPWPLRSALDYG